MKTKVKASRSIKRAKSKKRVQGKATTSRGRRATPRARRRRRANRM